MNSCGIHGNFLWKGCAKVIIEHQGQALTVAMEMERRAIRTYERALLLAKDEEVRKGIEDILGDERRHLKRFTEMWDKTGGTAGAFAGDGGGCAVPRRRNGNGAGGCADDADGIVSVRDGERSECGGDIYEIRREV